MCKTQEAILAMAKKYGVKEVAIMLEHVKVIGTLKMDENDYYEGIVSLKEVHVHCYQSEKVKHMKYINIPSHMIGAFTFDLSCDCK